jgi:hypothetical protein
VTNPADAKREAELLRAARRLLVQHINLDAVYALHAEVAKGLGKEALTPPAGERTFTRAREQQQRLQGLLDERVPAKAGIPLRRFLQRGPWWAPRAVVAGLLVVLTLRYAWAVKQGTAWQRQNPEGNWISRYYPDEAFNGNPMLRYDVGVNVDFGTGGPVRRLSSDNFSIRWDTCLVVQHEVVVPFTIQADDRASFFIDGTPHLSLAEPGVATGEVRLMPGVRHLRVEFVERKGTALIRLMGLELEGSAAYVFRRPKVNGLELTCSGVQ